MSFIVTFGLIHVIYYIRYWDYLRCRSGQDSSDSSYVPTEAEKLELRTAYPPRLLEDGNTLEEAGLSPNGTIHARKLK